MAGEISTLEIVNRMALLNEESSEGGPKLSEVLFDESTSATSLATLGSNYEAIEAGRLFSAGHESFLALVGPSGWGKSHLLDVLAKRMDFAESNLVRRWTASDYLHSPGKHNPALPLLLDDVQEILGRTKARIELRVVLERRVRAGRPTALSFTMDEPNRTLRSFLPNSRSWLIAKIREANAHERITLIERMGAAEGLYMSGALVKIIAHHMSGDGRTLAGALKRLRLSGHAWLDTRATLRALGVLDPYFADNPTWDLRMRIAKVGGQLLDRLGGIEAFDLAVYTMLYEAGLAESGISGTLGLKPVEVYQRASRVQKEICVNDDVHRAVLHFVALVVDSFTFP